LGQPLPPGPNVVAVIEAAFLAALVACIGGATATRTAGFLAIRAVLLPAKIRTTNEEDAPAKRATQLIQRDFVFHPHGGRRENGRPGLLALSSLSSSFIRLTEDPELELWVLILLRRRCPLPRLRRRGEFSRYPRLGHASAVRFPRIVLAGYSQSPD
jgi:hypothetical protein